MNPTGPLFEIHATLTPVAGKPAGDFTVKFDFPAPSSPYQVVWTYRTEETGPYDAYVSWSCPPETGAPVGLFVLSRAQGLPEGVTLPFIYDTLQAAFGINATALQMVPQQQPASCGF